MPNSLERYNKTDVNLHTFYAALISRELLSRVRCRVCFSYAGLFRKRLFTHSQTEFRHAGGTEALANIIIIFNYTSSAMPLHFEATKVHIMDGT